ncbi:MAG: ATP-binding protein, partial [Elusimicrobiaceae bacterium]|nr:ATP-binding protein [Elusimicrobiaceae bacterium]
PASHFLMPLFEAIVNSIHAIDYKQEKDGKILIHVYREKLLPNIANDKRYVPKITGFDIYDNGIGFNDENMTSFIKSDSRYKYERRGGKGLGRFLWLKAFETVHIESTFTENNQPHFRHFDFIPYDPGIANIQQGPDTKNKTSYTRIELRGFAPKYADNTCKALVLANHIATHLFNEIMAPHCPAIILTDEMQEQDIVINDLVNKDLVVKTDEENITIKNNSFKIKHVLLKDKKNERHTINFCADNRVVRTRSLVLPNLEPTLQTNTNKMVYTAFVSSTFLNQNTNNERTAFYIQEDFDLNSNEITWVDIDPEIDRSSATYLAPYLHETEEHKNRLIEQYLSNEGAEFAPLREDLDLASIDIQTAKNPNALDLLLYKKRQKLERDAREKGHRLIACVPEDNEEEYTHRINELFDNFGKLNSSALAKYVCGRKAILEIIEKLLQLQDNNKYPLEKAIHNLIYSMGKDSNTLTKEHNLWMIDERLPFNNYVSSDKKFKSMDDRVSFNQGMEPDLAVFHDLYAYSEDFPNDGAITFIEFKKPDRDDYTLKENPIQQILNQVAQVKTGEAKSDKGIRYQKDSRFYGYIICTLTPSLIKIIDERSEIHPFPSRGGYFGFFSKQNLYLEIIDYQEFLKNAKKRNRAFFNKLGIPS